MFDSEAVVTAAGLEGLLAVLARVEQASFATGTEETVGGPPASAATTESTGSPCLSDEERIDVLTVLERVKAAVGAAQVRVTAGFVASQEQESLGWRAQSQAALDANDFGGWLDAREKADLASWAAALEFGAHADTRGKAASDDAGLGAVAGSSGEGGGATGAGEPERRPSSSRRNLIAKGGVAAQVALARHLSPFKGAEGIRFSLSLTHDMPHTLALLEAGGLSEWRALSITKEAAILSPEHRRQLDQELHDTYGDRLGGLGDRELNRLVRAVAYRLDPESVLRRARKAESERRVTVKAAPDTMAYLTALLPAAEAVAAYAALTGAAASAKAAGDERGKSQVMADTLVDRVLGHANTVASEPNATADSADAPAEPADAAAAPFDAGSETAAGSAGSAGSAETCDRVDTPGEAGAPADGCAGADGREAADGSGAADAGPTGGPRPRGARLAGDDRRTDAATPEPAGRAGVDVEVQLVMGLDALFNTGEGADTPAQLLGYGTVPAGWAREYLRPADTHHPDDPDDPLADPGGGSPARGRGGGLSRAGRVWIRRLFVRPGTGELVAMDSRRRLFSDGLRRFVLTRDAATCRTPWCDAPARHVDHVTPHADGGPTTAANGQGLCVACNLTKEHPDLTSTTLPPDRRGASGGGRGHTVRVTTGTGHTYDSEAPPLLPGAPPPPPKRPRDSGHPFPTMLWTLPADPTTQPASMLERRLQQLIDEASAPSTPSP
ncbi:5-methylcytosine-specific restriction endonuclease McrA [Terracoccus luteus]|uniref:5-methylcytosine-specific restriction endonuclease McrA n=1 Tax=Terracoccus luteus TaxID=53356 RepID=A0A495Y1I9_9MICO|nr:HNH endonuclease signature motif containing protein [Terracoccus luteus]RKT79285.1 5-methylcytosine-specific restriction endonuclease McrA [Terracoccus luteus]